MQFVETDRTTHVTVDLTLEEAEPLRRKYSRQERMILPTHASILFENGAFAKITVSGPRRKADGTAGAVVESDSYSSWERREKLPKEYWDQIDAIERSLTD